MIKKKHTKKETEGFVQILLGAIIMLAIVIWAGWAEFKGTFSYSASDYVTTPGKVIVSEVERKFHTGGRKRKSNYAFHYNIEYIFKVQGETYKSKQINFNSTTGSKDGHIAREYTEKYPKGAEVIVYYLESDPSFSVLEPKNNALKSYIFIGLLIGSVLIIGVIAFYTDWADKKEPKQRPASSLSKRKFDSGDDIVNKINGIINVLGNPELTESERLKISHEFHKVSKEHEDTLLRILQSEPLESSNILFEVYEALSVKPDVWFSLILDEIERILYTARKSQHPSKVLSPLGAISFYNELANESKALIRDKFVAELRSQLPSIRWYAVDILGDFISADDASSISALQKVLHNDLDWKVRNCAFLVLQDIDALPLGYRQNLFDRVRIKMAKSSTY